MATITTTVTARVRAPLQCREAGRFAVLLPFVVPAVMMLLPFAVVTTTLHGRLARPAGQRRSVKQSGVSPT